MAKTRVFLSTPQDVEEDQEEDNSPERSAPEGRCSHPVVERFQVFFTLW